jgi:hypothetical protein
MFIITDIRHPFLLWTSVTLKAETDMSATDERLTLNKLGAPALEKRVLQVREGETFTINAWRFEGYRIGDRLTLDQVAKKLEISLKWRTVSTV